MKTFGERLREERKREGMTLADVAGRVGISIPYLSDIERGERHCPPLTAERIAEAINCDNDWINPVVTIRVRLCEVGRMRTAAAAGGEGERNG